MESSLRQTLSMVDLGKRLLEAAKHGLTEEVRTLMSNGAPFTTDWLGTSPLHFSSHHGHLGTSEVLLRAGISRDARTKVDRTPLHVASQEGYINIVELLVRNGADVDAKDMLKMTPLHWAVEKGHSVVIEFLLEHGAEVSCQNKFEKSPIDIAIGNGRADLAQLLQQNVVEVSTSAEEHGPFVGEVTEVSAADAETIAATESVVGAHHGIVTTSSGASYINASNINSGKKGESTEVLATLAALAEATAGGSDGTATTPTTTDAETLKWLESQGITMISADNTTIVGNTVENGQQLTLTEAGRLALNQIVKQRIGDSAETDGNIVTIVSSDGMENPMGDSMVINTEIHTEEDENEDDEPSLKRIKLERPHDEDDGLDPHEGVVLDDDINIKLEGTVVEETYGVEEEYLTETVDEELCVGEHEDS